MVVSLSNMTRYHAMGLGFLKGCTSTAFTTQANSQLKQVQQSWGYLIFAFFVSSMMITSPGQIISQTPHPMHARSSIFRIIQSSVKKLFYLSTFYPSANSATPGPRLFLANWIMAQAMNKDKAIIRNSTLFENTVMKKRRAVTPKAILIGTSKLPKK